jgi:hypothetical protein
MVISCFTADDWSRGYLLPDTVRANIPLRGSIGEPGAYNAACGLLVEVCRFTGAAPLSLRYLEEERPGELLTTIIARADLRDRTVTVITQYRMPLRTNTAECWLISVNDELLAHEQHRHPPSPPYQGSIVARWLQP